MISRSRLVIWGTNAFLIVGLLLGFLIVYSSRCSRYNENDPHIIELKRIASETPVYDRFQRTGEKVVVKSSLIYYFVYYRCSAHFSEVKSFYDRVLAEKGWGPPKQAGPSLFDPNPAVSAEYRKGDYVITIEQNEREPDHFDLVFMWDPP